MTVFQVLPEVVGTIKLFGLVAFAKLVFLGEVFNAESPLGRQWELFSAVTAYVGKVGLVG